MADGRRTLHPQARMPRTLVPERGERHRQAAGPRWVIAHRGDHGVEPENSLAAFAAAIHGGLDLIETDLRRCRDGVVVVHDAHAGGRPVASMSRREIRDETGVLPAGLDDVVELCRGRIGLDLELKEPGLEAEVLDAVTPFFRPAEYFISSFDAEVLAAVRNLDGDVRTGLLSARGLAALPGLDGAGPDGARPDGAGPDARSAGDLLALMRAVDADYLLPDAVDRELIALGAAAGATLIPWYVNTADQVSETLSLPAVAGAITDCPYLMREVQESR
jgi:glycerophosphoryl diester phosphodiesterase